MTPNNNQHGQGQPQGGWDGVSERRVIPIPHTAEIVTRAELERKMAEGRGIMTAHIDKQFQDLQELIKSGFPNGDTRSHREVHEGFMQEAAERRALWKAIREKTVVGAFYSALIFLALAAWESIKSQVTK